MLLPFPIQRFVRLGVGHWRLISNYWNSLFCNWNNFFCNWTSFFHSYKKQKKPNAVFIILFSLYKSVYYMTLFAEKRWHFSRKNYCKMTPFAEKSKMSIVFWKQKCPLNIQICPAGYLIISVLLEVKALLQQNAIAIYPQTLCALRGWALAAD